MSDWLHEMVEVSAGQLDTRATEALLSRGVSPQQMELYQIGYIEKTLPECVPDSFAKWWSGKKLADVFVLPLTTPLGAVGGFQFRSVEREGGTYLDHYVNRVDPCLFGLHQAMPSIWKTRSVFLVEGAFDLFPVQRATPTVVATLTAHTPKSMSRFLKRVVDRAWVGYDMDKPGRFGCVQFEKDHRDHFKVYTVEYPKVNNRFMKDPGDLWEAWGDAQLVPFIQAQLNPIDDFLD